MKPTRGFLGGKRVSFQIVLGYFKMIGDIFYFVLAPESSVK